MVDEANILRCRCAHFCTEQRIKDLRRLVKLDASEVYFDDELVIKDLENPKGTHE